MKSRRGLSLLEVLIVITLIVVLMVLSLPMLTKANAQARLNVCKQNLSEIGQAIADYAHDTKRLPTLYEAPPQAPEMSLPEFVTPRLKSPNALFCPSDESELSHQLETSYRWDASINGRPADSLSNTTPQPVLADRSAYHQGSGLPTNELVLQRAEAGLLFVVQSVKTPSILTPAPPLARPDGGDDNPPDAADQDHRPADSVQPGVHPSPPNADHGRSAP